MPCKQYFLNYFGQNKGCHGLLQLFTIKFIFFDKAMNSGKKVWKLVIFIISFLNQQKSEIWVWNDCTDNGRDWRKIFNLSVKNWRSYGHIPCCHGNCHLNFFLDAVFQLIEAEISFYIFFWFSCRQFLFTMSVFREIRRKASIGNDDVIVLMMSWNLWRHSMRMSLIYVMSFWELFYSQLEMLICFSLKLSRIKMLSNRNQCSVKS